MSEIINNGLYSDSDRNSFWRAIYQDQDNDHLAICLIKEKSLESSKLNLVSLESYKELIRAETYTLHKSDPFVALCAEDDLSVRQRAIRDQRLSLLEPLLSVGIELFKKKNQDEIITQIARESNVSAKSLNRYMSLYFSKGCMPAALIPQYRNSGAPEVERKSSRKLGRPGNPSIGMALSKSDKRLLQKGFIEFYANNSLSSMYAAYTDTTNKYFNKEGYVEDGDKLKIPLPSEYQFRYWGKKAISAAALEAKRCGAIIYNKDRQMLKGCANERVLGPGSLYQIDSTQADINLVSTFDPNVSIGRPTLYLITDVYSRMIVGFTITLENASYISAALALHTASLDKVELCRKHDLNIEKDDWPSTGLPNALLADRAELRGEMGNSLVDNLSIILKIAKSYRPDWKGNVESLLGTLQSRIRKSFNEKGAITKSDGTRIGSDSREEAILTLNQLNDIVVRYIVDYNKHHYIESYPLTEDMVQNKVKPIPCELWQYGHKNGLNSTRQIDTQEMYLKILPRKMVVIDKEGVKLYGVDYTTKDREALNILNNMLSANIKRVQIAYDPRNLKKIFLVLKNKFVTLEPRTSKLMSRDVWDYRALIKQQRADAIEQRKKESISRAASNSYTAKVIESATNTQERKVETENISENRARDINHARQDVLPHEGDNVVKEKSTSSLNRRSFSDIFKKS